MSTQKLADSFGEKLRAFRLAMELSQQEFSERSGINQKTLSRYERDESEPRLSDIEALQKLGMSILTERAPLVEAKSTDGLVLVPRYDLQASAGPGSWVDEESVVDHLAFKADWIRRAIGTDPRNLALVDGVRGDSMEPTLRAGDLILVNRAVRRLQDDAIYVVSFDGQLLVKRISRVLGGAEVRSDNPAYPPFMVRGDELDQLVIAGRVVWFARVI